MALAAYLRVYVPVSDRPVTEHIAGLPPRVLQRGAYGVSFESSREDDFVLEWDGKRYACPRRPHLRMLEGLLAFRNAYPDMVAETLVPESLARSAAAELEALRRREPGVRSHILTSPFHVPPRWFAAFNPKERELVQRADGLTVRYRTGRVAAVRRLQRALRILGGAGFEEEAIVEVRELVDWLRAFPADAVVELDYGGVARLFPDAELAIDDSAVEIAASLRALHAGDFRAAGEHYSRVAARWSHPQSLSFAN